MRTILHAIMDAACCAGKLKNDPPNMKGVTLRWVEVEASEYLGQHVVQAYATDGKVLAVVHVEPGENWPRHEPIIVSAEGVKAIGQLLKRVDKILDDRPNESTIRGQIETWCDAVAADGRKINPRQVLRIDVQVAGDGVVVPLVGNGEPLNIDAVMRPRRLTLGTPAGLLSTELVQAAQDSIGDWAAPIWYTDGRSGFLFNRIGGERHLDFALVMPITPAEIETERWPWGRPKVEDAAEPNAGIIVEEEEEGPSGPPVGEQE